MRLESVRRSKAVISLAVMGVIFLYLLYTTPRQEWGDISQSLLYHQVRKLLLKLDAARRDIFTIATAIILKSTTLTGNGKYTP